MVILKLVCNVNFLKGSGTWAIDRFNGLFGRAHRAAYRLNLEETLSNRLYNFVN